MKEEELGDWWMISIVREVGGRNASNGIRFLGKTRGDDFLLYFLVQQEVSIS